MLVSLRNQLNVNFTQRISSMMLISGLNRWKCWFQVNAWWQGCWFHLETSKMSISRSTYSTDQKKPNRECLTEHVLFPFHSCSRSHSVSVPYPFCIRSIPILYPFFIRSVLFCSRSVSVPSVSILGTRSEERGFQELVYKICISWNGLKLSPLSEN